MAPTSRTSLNAAVLNLNYDVVADFEPIALIGKTPWLFAAKKDLPANNLREMIAWLKANPDKASFGTAGNGSPSHIAGVLFQNVTGTKFQLIPYRGIAPVIPDLVSGQIELSILDPITVAAAVPRRKNQDFRRDDEQAHRQRARHSDRRRGRRARRAHGAVAGDLGAEGHAQGRHRQAQRRGRQRAERSRRSARSSPSRATSSRRASS